MRLTPLDIRKQEFTRGIRGYDADEVIAFLQMLSSQWEDLLDESRRKEEKIRDLEHKMAHYEKVEEALQEALQTARETSKEALQNAEEKARLIVDAAEQRAEEIKRDAEQDRHQIKRETAKLSGRRSEIVTRLRAFLMSEMEILAHFEGDDPLGFLKLMPGQEKHHGSPTAVSTAASEMASSHESRAPADEAGNTVDTKSHSADRSDQVEIEGGATDPMDEPIPRDETGEQDSAVEEQGQAERDAGFTANATGDSTEETNDAAVTGEEPTFTTEEAAYNEHEAASENDTYAADSEDVESTATRIAAEDSDSNPEGQEEYGHASESESDEEAPRTARWTNRSVISQPPEHTTQHTDESEDTDENDDEETGSPASSDEIEKIRRILSDFD